MGKSAERTRELYDALTADQVAWEPAPQGLPPGEAIRWGRWTYQDETFYILAKDDVHLIFDRDEWDAYLDGRDNGEFDLPDDRRP